LPRLMKGALAMRRFGSWSTTVANAWGVVAVDKFVHAFEVAPLSGATQVSLLPAAQELDWARNPRGASLSFAWPSGPEDLKVVQSGSGRPWVEIRTSAATPLSASVSAGYKIVKTISPVEVAHQGGWHRSDLVRVHLKIDAETDLTWVVVDDPIPAGASHLGTGLSRESALATATENASGENYSWPAFVERPFDAYRAYYEYIPKGTFETEYTIRLNQTGKFVMPPTHVAALYEPDMYGELPNPPLEVAP
jgi:alpha-2-macroglobulin